MSLALLLPGVVVFAQSSASTLSYRVIAYPGIPTTILDRGFLSDVFLKKVTRWRNGDAIHPVDLVDSAVRRKFDEDVLQRSVAAVRSYWQQVVFTGRGLPPPELESEAEVVRYVLRTPGAIGYVSSEVPTGGAKVLEIR